MSIVVIPVLMGIDAVKVVRGDGGGHGCHGDCGC